MGLYGNVRFAMASIEKQSCGASMKASRAVRLNCKGEEDGEIYDRERDELQALPQRGPPPRFRFV